VTATCPNGHVSGADDFCDTCGAKIDPSKQAPAAEGPAAGTPGTVPAPEQTCPNCQTANAVDALFCEACGYDFTTGALPRGAVRESSPQGAGQGSPGGSLSLDATPGGVGAASPEGEGSAGEASEVEADEGGASAGEAPEVEANEGAPTAAREADGAPVGAGGNVAPTIPLEWVAEVWVDPDWYAGQEAEEPMPSPGLPNVVPLLHRSALVGRMSTSRNITPDIDCTSDTGVSRRHAQLSTDGRRWFVEDLGSSNGTFIGPASGPLPEDPIAVGPRTELDDDDRIYVGAWTRIVVRAATEDEVAAQTG